MSSLSAREAQVGERGGDVEVEGEGEGGEQPLAPPPSSHCFKIPPSS